jgi:hypothetical protein
MLARLNRPEAAREPRTQQAARQRPLGSPARGALQTRNRNGLHSSGSFVPSLRIGPDSAFAAAALFSAFGGSTTVVVLLLFNIFDWSASSHSAHTNM